MPQMMPQMIQKQVIMAVGVEENPFEAELTEAPPTVGEKLGDVARAAEAALQSDEKDFEPLKKEVPIAATCCDMT